MSTSKASQKAVNKYIASKYDRINLITKKGQKEKYKEIAKSEGKSLNQYIIECIEKNIK